MSTARVVDAARPTQSVLGALALLLTSATLVPLFTSNRWVLPVAATVTVIALVGFVLRAVRMPALLVVVGQLIALTATLTLVFTDAGVFRVLPGPAAISRLRDLLTGASNQIVAEKVPVALSPEMSLLVVGSLGCAAIIVDVLVALARVPAIAGLVLLSVVAVPASLTRELLPWWSFVLGAGGLVLLFLSDGARRRITSGPGAGTAGLRSPGATIAIVAAVAGALAVGSMATGVGTSGRLPDSGQGAQGVALNPFTQLRGELGERTATPLFTVTGMTQPTYLRTITLDRFVNNQGWEVGTLASGAPASSKMGNQALVGPVQTVTVRGQQYDDRWLPSPGFPTSVRGVDAPLRGYTYNVEAGVLASSQRKVLPTYTVDAVNPGASPEQLRQIGRGPQSQAGIDSRWRELGGVDPRVAQLANTIAGPAPTTFDAAVALSTYFTNPANGFRYELIAGAGGIGNDALVDFLTVNKSGFCEQYASAMAVMLRELGIASRVVLGYTSGNGDAAQRTITTDDAHAWVEVYFAGVGWVTFDPTPLTGGRGVVPDYVAHAAAAPTAPSPAPAQIEPVVPVPPSSVTPAPTVGPRARAESSATTDPSTAGGHAGTSVAIGLAAVLLALLSCAPAALRRRRRTTRLEAARPDAAWAELRDLARDRGDDIASTETPRAAARRLASAHGLDENARRTITEVIDAVEQQWYGDPAEASVAAPSITELVVAWQRCSPLTKRQRWLPRSVWLRQAPRAARSADSAPAQLVSSGRNDA